jgi:hypothetical protein
MQTILDGIIWAMGWLKRFLAGLQSPFRSNNRLDVRIILVFCIINGMVLYNGIFHDPRIGYDAAAHLAYIQALAKMHLVSVQESSEYFSPPLPYGIPALGIALTGMDIYSAAKLGQIINVLLSIGATFLLIKICQLIHPHPSLRLGTLLFLGILPVYYKTFAFVRGEPYVVFFAMVAMYGVLRMLYQSQYTTHNAILLGVSMGLCALSRQWGILLFPAIIILYIAQWIRLPSRRHLITKTLGISFVLATLVGGWFYLFLNHAYGTSLAFNRRPAASFSLANQPYQFYLGSGSGELFRHPVRPNFANQFLPIFYSEVWGDYWGFFTIYSKDTRNATYLSGFELEGMLAKGQLPYWLETNYFTEKAYLGEVNIVSIFPTLVVLISILVATADVIRKQDAHAWIPNQRALSAFLLLCVFVTAAGYFWFLIMYPNRGKGDTIKATYMIQAVPFIALLAGVFLSRIQKKSRLFYFLIIGGIGMVFVHNFPAMITHYWR